jgi:hypothetical protein
MNAQTEREQILSALAAFIKQRPGLEFGNYGDVSAYRSEMRQITKDRHQAETLLAAVSWRESIGAKQLKEAFRAYSGRLTWDGKKLDYCTGQYFPTEYRRAVCAVLSAALWDYYRDQCMPKPDKREKHDKQAPDTYKGMSAGDYLRTTLRREFGRTIANRWFN